MNAIAHITAFTHRGRVRPQNEDAVVVGEWIAQGDMAEPCSFRHALDEPIVCAVADGLGGHMAGEVASRHAAQRLAAEGGRLGSAQAVEEALHRINDELYRAMAQDPACVGMGTTIVGLVLSGKLVRFNAGDSRLYRFDGGHLSQLSIDDTPPGPRSGRITQSLGGVWPEAALHPHVAEEPLIPPARFLLCSDGLTDMVGDREIARCLALADADAALQLFDLAMRAGGADNISVVLVCVADGDG